jgi:hypothetical protein
MPSHWRLRALRLGPAPASAARTRTDREPSPARRRERVGGGSFLTATTDNGGEPSPSLSEVYSLHLNELLKVEMSGEGYIPATSLSTRATRPVVPTLEGSPAVRVMVEVAVVVVGTDVRRKRPFFCHYHYSPPTPAMGSSSSAPAVQPYQPKAK